MNTRRTYLDTLNAGRQRNSEASLEQLSRSLEHLEQQLAMHGRGRVQASTVPAPARARAQETPQTQAPAYGRSDPYRSDTVAEELRTLRDEMRQQINADLRREFDVLRRQLEQSQATSRDGGSVELGFELERLADSVQSLAERHDDKGLNVLRLELEQFKSMLSALAREDTVRSVGARWDDMDRKLASLQANLGASVGHANVDPALAALSERLNQIGLSVDQLPESLSINRLEEKIRNLAGAVDHFSRQQEKATPSSLSIIEGRLEEISRAIVAASMSSPAAVDLKPFERIESRLNTIARQFDLAEKPSDALIDRLNMLAQRVEEIAAASALPDRAIEKLGRQIAALSEKVTNAPAVAGLDNSTLQSLERRLSDVSQRLDQAPASSASEEAILGMQDRLEFLASKIDSSNRVGDVDPALIQSLETQLGALSGFLANPPASSNSDIAQIAPRLERLEASWSGNRNEIVQAAREAAEAAVRTFSGSRGDSAVVSGLTQDLKALEALTRRSDDRNAKTFEAIHDTLMKVVDRLSSIDLKPERSDPSPRVFGKAETPPLDIENYDEPALQADDAAINSQMSPAQAAAAAAAAALAEIEGATQETARPRGMAGLARSLRGKDSEPLNLPGSQPIPEVALDAPLDPAVANRPLEPGSRAPDLNAIMSRVREDRDAASRGDGEAARSDFIAAARRAAQAAAAEAEVLKRSADTAAPRGKFKLLDSLRSRRKPILMAVAAIVVALAGLQLSNSFLSDPQDIAETTIAPSAPVADQSVTPASDEPVRVVGSEDDMPTEPAVANAGSPPASAAQPDIADAAPQPAPSGELTATNAGGLEPTALPSAATTPTMVAAAPMEASGSEQKFDIPANAGPAPLREAAASGDAKALFEIGSRYAEGRGGASDMAAAATWYERAADLGFAPAQYRTGNLYEKGLGVTRDVKKAKTWYQMAADQGNASAMHNLAVLFATDAGQGADNESAARWFGKAAALGVKDSQFNLGILSAKGVGMPQNLEEAYKWFALVAKAGDRDAAQKRDDIGNTLRPEQLSKARGLVDAWKPEQLNVQANSVEMPESWRESDAKTAGIDMTKAVRNVQALLNKAGYDAGAADGKMGGKTKQAIADFQKANDMEPTGEIDEKMVKALLAKK